MNTAENIALHLTNPLATFQGITSSAVESAATNAPSKVASGFLSNLTGGFLSNLTGGLGNMTLVAVGIVMALGALLISQRQTIVKIGDAAAKGAALVG